MGSPPHIIEAMPESNFFILSIIDVNRRKELAESPEPRTTWSSLFGRQKQCFDRVTEQSTNDDNDGWDDMMVILIILMTKYNQKHTNIKFV